MLQSSSSDPSTTKQTLEIIQADPSLRVKSAKKIETSIAQKFDTSTDTSTDVPCKETWKMLFHQSFVAASRKLKTWGKSATRLGGGTYGSVYRVTLKPPAPPVPIAIKKSNTMELDEARRMVFLSLLVEENLVPHFLILYSHFHCEKEESKKRPQNALTWKEAADLINTQKEKRKEIETKLANSSLSSIEKRALEAEKRDIVASITWTEKRRLPTLQEQRDWLRIKTKLEDGLNIFDIQNVESRGGANISKLSEEDRAVLHNVARIYHKIVQERAKFYKPYELMAMEYADGAMDKWIQSRSTTEPQILSGCFQVCASILAMQTYGDFIHNDLGLRNIVFNRVPTSTTYCYKIGTKLFRVPLEGHLMKMIDFGLTVTSSAYLKYPKNRWCPGGERRDKKKKKDGREIECVPHMRDFIEFFYELMRYKRYLSPQMVVWANAVLRLAVDTNIDGWNPGDGYDTYNKSFGKKAAEGFVQKIFSTKMLVNAFPGRGYEYEVESCTPLPKSAPLFSLTDQKIPKKTLRKKMREKIWYESKR